MESAVAASQPADFHADPVPCKARKVWSAERRRTERGSHWISPVGRRSRWRTRVFGVATGVIALCMRFAGLYARGRRNALAPRLIEFDLPFPDLPASFDGYRILLLSDTHLDALPELGEIAGRILDGTTVDLLALGGDILAAHNSPLRSATEPLARLIAGVTARDNRLAVLGNHDPATMADALSELGFEVLINRSIALARGDENIVITGLDDVHCFYTEAARTAFFDSTGGFRIAVVHSPEMADQAAEAGVSLYLCGHTHGGQICLPGGRPLVSRLNCCRFAARGLWRDGSTLGYTSCGLGSSWPPLRYNCPGEMTVITLRRGNSEVGEAQISVAVMPT